MDNDIIQAYLWQEVIRLAFSPSGNADMKRWLLQWGRSIKTFWEVEDYPSNPTIIPFTAEIQSSANILMQLNYSISSIGKFSVAFDHIDNNRNLMWIHDVDSQYFSFPQQHFLTNYNQGNQRNPAINEMTISDIESVIDSLLLHPRAHQHIQSPIDKHEIRICGGIENPFVFLFHLRYQLCPDLQKRDNERNRLNNLFYNKVKNREILTINDLFAIN